MQFILALEMADAEQEAVWLKEHLDQDDFPDVVANVRRAPTIDGAMSGGMLTNILELLATTAVTEGMKSFIGYLFQHFKYKHAKIELSGTCPDTGRELKLSFDTGSSQSRDAAILEFERIYNTLCRPVDTPTSSTL